MPDVRKKSDKNHFNGNGEILGLTAMTPVRKLNDPDHLEKPRLQGNL